MDLFFKKVEENGFLPSLQRFADFQDKLKRKFDSNPELTDQQKRELIKDERWLDINLIDQNIFFEKTATPDAYKDLFVVLGGYFTLENKKGKLQPQKNRWVREWIVSGLLIHEKEFKEVNAKYKLKSQFNQEKANEDAAIELYEMYDAYSKDEGVAKQLQKIQEELVESIMEELKTKEKGLIK